MKFTQARLKVGKSHKVFSILPTIQNNENSVSILFRFLIPIPNSLQPKFISQSQIHFSLKCIKSLAFCRNNG